MSAVIEEVSWLHRAQVHFASEGAAEAIPENLRSLQQQALQQLDSEPLPARRMERWRYTPVEKLLQLPLQPGQPSAALAQDVSDWFTPGLDAFRLVFVNGRFQASLSSIDGLPAGVTVESMQQARIQHAALLQQHAGQVITRDRPKMPFAGSAGKADSRVFQWLNLAALADGVFVHVAAGVQFSKPLEVLYIKTAETAALVQTHNLVVLENDASMTLLEKHLSTDAVELFSNNQLELVIGDNARCEHVYLQQEADGVYHRTAVDRLLGNGSSYRGWAGCLGGKWSRLEFNSQNTGSNSNSELYGVQLAADGQVNDIHLDIHHNLPSCDSEQHFRGMASGAGKIVFDGSITVAQDAQKTSAHLSDKNLMLDRRAEVDAKPQLEIYADDVQCSHGTTVGELDSQQLFYLRSRGIGQARARSMLSMGFIAEMVERLPFDGLRDSLMQTIEARLALPAAGDQA